MKHFLWLLLTSSLLLSCERQKVDTPYFSFHLFSEPQQLDHSIYSASSASYFFYNTLRGLYRVDGQNQLMEEGGRCQWAKQTQLKCTLKEFYWSNGDPVTAQDYVRSFQRLVAPETASPRANLLFSLKNGKEILQGLKKPEELGIKAIGSKTLLIDFNQKDYEFIYKLSSTALYPRHKNQVDDRKDYLNFLSNGPYQIESWDFGHKMILKPNSHYPFGHSERPRLRLYFIDDEMTAFRLYEKGELSFLRRVPSQLIPQLKNRKDFFQTPMLRFDYIGFGPKLLKSDELRRALVHAIDYDKLKTLLGGLERPGCPSIPKSWMVNQPCYEFIPEKAKEFLKKVPPNILKSTFQFDVSSLGGKDIKKQAEFIQNQWKRHLGIDVQVNQLDQKVFISELRLEPEDIFRKGVGLDRPTCLNALETFSSDSKRNLIQFKDQSYLKILSEMKSLDPQTLDYKNTCQKAVQYLLDQVRLIPLGEIHFTLMASPRYTGWEINGLNQLDLSQVRLLKP